MGNAPAKLNSATVCDGGNLSPNGIYAEDAQDFDVSIVQRLILGRQLAPFYVGADDPDPAEPAATADGEGSSSAAGSGGDSSQCANDDGWWSYNLMLAQQQQQLQKNTEGKPENQLLQPRSKGGSWVLHSVSASEEV
ncbi:hypothetical protein GQ54DRAFT_264539 [Martensiomyces pterosporus]|nr:hypothetical protein GQ54DRAFT_264539 [Martensiomyces pterosporus]